MKKTIFILVVILLASCKKRYVEVIPTVSLQYITSPVSSALNSTSFISASEGFICGTGGIVFKTSNGGSTWTNISLPLTTVNIHKVLFRTSLKGFLATDQGIYITTDGGANWTQKLFSYNTNDIQFVTNNIGYAVGEEGSPTPIYKTWDGGNTWTNFNVSYIYSNIYAVSFINKDTGYIAGDDAILYETTNGGNTWNGYLVDSKWQARAYTGKIADLFFTGYKTGYVCGDGGYLNRITPASSGSGIRHYPLINDYDYNLTSVACRGGGSAAVGRNSVLMPYPEFGSELYSWTYYLSPEATTLPYSYNDVGFADENVYYAVGNGGVITKFQYPD